MKKSEMVEQMLERFTTNYNDIVVADELDDMIIVRSSDKEVLQEMYSWCIENRVFATHIDDAPYEPGEYEFDIDPTFFADDELDDIAIIRQAFENEKVYCVSFVADGSGVNFNFTNAKGEVQVLFLEQEDAFKCLRGYRMKQHELKVCF